MLDGLAFPIQPSPPALAATRLPVTIRRPRLSEVAELEDLLAEAGLSGDNRVTTPDPGYHFSCREDVTVAGGSDPRPLLALLAALGDARRSLKALAASTSKTERAVQLAIAETLEVFPDLVAPAVALLERISEAEHWAAHQRGGAAREPYPAGAIP